MEGWAEAQEVGVGLATTVVFGGRVAHGAGEEGEIGGVGGGWGWFLEFP